MLKAISRKLEVSNNEIINDSFDSENKITVNNLNIILFVPAKINKPV